MYTLAFAMPGPLEMIIVGVICVLLFGQRLPQVAKSFGQSLMSFKKGFKEVELEVEEMERVGRNASSELTAELKETERELRKPV
jgi:sec-independent protein translocase protein TatA